MHSQLRSCPIRRWLSLTACVVTISVSVFSCSVSVDANAPSNPTPPPNAMLGRLVRSPW